MQVSLPFETCNSQKIYNLTDCQSFMLAEKLGFPNLATKVRLSSSQTFLGVAGGYGPALKVFDLEAGHQKFERGLTCDIEDFLFLDDWQKMVILEDDRQCEFHNRQGKHHKLRLPSRCKSLNFSPNEAHLFGASSLSAQVFRFDCDQGTFLTPLQSETMSHMNQMDRHPKYPLLAIAGCDSAGGATQFFDFRLEKPVFSLPSFSGAEEDTVVRFSPYENEVCVGNSGGQVGWYDLRVQTPLCRKNHRSSAPISDIQFLDRHRMGSSDNQGIKFWTQSDHLLGITRRNIRNFQVFKDSGLLVCANDTPEVGLFFMPSLGQAPQFCGQLDGITEELEDRLLSTQEDQLMATSEDTHKFLTRDEIREIGAEFLLANQRKSSEASLCQPYLNGFLIPKDLYDKIKTPFDYAAWERQRLEKKLKEKRGMRIAVKEKGLRSGLKGAKVNKKLIKELEAKIAKAKKGQPIYSESEQLTKAECAKNILADDRFKALFFNEDFALDPDRSK